MEIMNKKLLLGTLIAFSLLFSVSLMINPVQTAINPLYLEDYLIQNLLYSNYLEGDSAIATIIINRDVALVHVAGLSPGNCKDGFIFVHPLSSMSLADFVLAILNNETLPSFNGIYYQGTVFPGYEFWNDSNGNLVLDIVNPGDEGNSTEAIYYLIPVDYSSYEYYELSTLQNLTLAINDKPVSYTWGIEYDDVIITVVNATLNELGQMDGYIYGNDSFDYLRYDYNYTFYPTLNEWELKRTVNISAWNNESEENYHENCSLSLVQLHLAGKVGASFSGYAFSNSSSVEFVSNESTPTKIVQFNIGTTDLGYVDNNLTYPTYVTNTLEYNATSVVNPSIRVDLDIWYENFTENQALNLEISGFALTSRICYPNYTGDSLYHDPVWFLPLLNPQIPLWACFLPEVQDDTILILVIIVLSAILIFVIADSNSDAIKNKVKRRKSTKPQKNPSSEPKEPPKPRKKTTKRTTKPKKRTKKAKSKRKSS